MNTAKIYVEIVPPEEICGSVAYTLEIERHEFDTFLEPIHINKNPFVPDDELRIKNIRDKREYFVEMVKEKIGLAFDVYFESRDTINGELVSKSAKLEDERERMYSDKFGKE